MSAADALSGPLPTGAGWQEVAALVRDAIDSGSFEVGDALPAERELSARLGVSRSSVREAIRHLESLGLLVTRHGSATRVAALSAAPLWPGPDNQHAEIFEVRQIVEPEAAALAAQRRSADDLRRLDDVVREMGRALDDGDDARVLATDREFHDLIGVAAGNSALVALLTRVQEFGDGERAASLAVPGQGIRARDGHAAILRAVRESDPQAARRAMAQHLDDAVRLLVAHTDDARRVPASEEESHHV